MTSALPEPSRRHATCAWCHTSFSTIGELLEHVDASHLDMATDRPRLAPAPTPAIAA
jgi:hypothetical protein